MTEVLAEGEIEVNFWGFAPWGEDSSQSEIKGPRHSFDDDRNHYCGEGMKSEKYSAHHPF